MKLYGFGIALVLAMVSLLASGCASRQPDYSGQGLPGPEDYLAYQSGYADGYGYGGPLWWGDPFWPGNPFLFYPPYPYYYASAPRSCGGMPCRGSGKPPPPQSPKLPHNTAPPPPVTARAAPPPHIVPPPPHIAPPPMPHAFGGVHGR